MYRYFLYVAVEERDKTNQLGKGPGSLSPSFPPFLFPPSSTSVFFILFSCCEKEVGRHKIMWH